MKLKQETVKIEYPWLTQATIDKCPWGEFTDFEKWFKVEMGDKMAEIYDELDPVFQMNLYALFVFSIYRTIHDTIKLIKE